MKAKNCKTKKEVIKSVLPVLKENIIFTSIAKNYFKRTSPWLMQRLHNYSVNGKDVEFKDPEFDVFSNALRSIAKKLNEIADLIDETPVR